MAQKEPVLYLIIERQKEENNFAAEQAMTVRVANCLNFSGSVGKWRSQQREAKALNMSSEPTRRPSVFTTSLVYQL